MMMMMAIQTILLPQVTVTAEARGKGPKRFIGNPMPPILTTCALNEISQFLYCSFLLVTSFKWFYLGKID